MFEKILIANRGEIACRIIRTAKRLGIGTVAVYSDADASSMHAELADEACHIGPSPARESYLRADLLIEAALKSGAEAVHPGYGFMSENADFAEACKKAGLIFIGPPAQAIRAMGSKSAAKKIMEKAGVPLIPGYHGENQEPELLRKEAEKTGYPLMIKAVMGGGGKGMRIVMKENDFSSALTAARREAMASFGDESVLLEKYISGPRHVEIQVFADNHGNAVYLFERDCSIQRRHQKIIEEAPAPGMTQKLREKMGAAAVDAAKARAYTGAGTVEFLLDESGNFYFMEMNTRLQVEHPVTEMITSVDLVEWQLRVACGEKLPCGQEDLHISGHAVEARIYAEDPSNSFLPSTGKLFYLSTPKESGNVRIDTGIREGDEVSMEYDPMIAKLIVWDVDRSSAVRRLHRALGEYHAAGVTTNVEFLRRVTEHPLFSSGGYDTGFIEQHESELFPARQKAPDRILALAALYIMLSIAPNREDSDNSGDPYSPWNMTHGWRLNCRSFHEISFIDGDSDVTVKVHYREKGYQLELPSGEMAVWGRLDGEGIVNADLGGALTKASVIRNGAEIILMTLGARYRLIHTDPFAQFEEQDDTGGSLTAPMPGRIIEVMVKEGDAVKRGDSLLTMEAMKMEHTIKAPGDGKVVELKYAVGDQVNEGEKLLIFEVNE